MFLRRLVNRKRLLRLVIFALSALVLLVCTSLWQKDADLIQVERVRKAIAAQPTPCPPLVIDIQSTESVARIQAAKKDFQLTYDVPEAFQDVFFYTLSYFPELQTSRLYFVFEALSTTLQVRPTVSSLLNNRKQRSYNIFVNSNRAFDGVFFADIPVSGQIGMLAHEFVHILDYQHKSFFQLLGTGLCFASTEARSSYEKSIDLLTIYKGFGQHIQNWTYYLENNSTASDRYKTFKRSIYFGNKDIGELRKTIRPLCE